VSEREEFEAWAARILGWRNFTRKNKGYTNDHLDEVWQAWEAAARRTVSGQQAKPIYQIEQITGRWTDIDKEMFDAWKFGKRIVYTHPSADVAALRERIAELEAKQK
jgi:hypothetical protein